MKKRLLIAGPVVGLVLGVLFFVVGLPGGSTEVLLDENGEVIEVEASHEDEDAEEQFAAVHVEGKLGPHLLLSDRVFTLISPIETPRYVKLQVVLEFETDEEGWFDLTGEALEEKLEEFHEEMPVLLIEDAVTSTVSAKTVADISSPAGKEQLRADIFAAITALLPEEHLYRVLFTNFITQ